MKVKILGVNRCEIRTDKAVYFQSYDTIVAVRHGGKVILSKDWQYSHTTAKHVGQWLGMPCSDIHKLIKNGVIKVVSQISESEIEHNKHSYAMD